MIAMDGSCVDVDTSNITVKHPIRHLEGEACSSQTDGFSESTLEQTSATTESEMSVSAFSASLRKEPLSDGDKQILVLIKSAPQPEKAQSPCMEDNFFLYPLALKVYKAVSQKKLPSELGVHFPNKSIKRKVYQLVFNVIYYHEILEEILVESSFYSHHFEMHSHEMLLHIMLYDFQSSKFTLQLPDHEVENVPQSVAKVSRALWEHRTKLNATLARMRIKGDALRVSQLITDPLARDICEANSCYPYYARINNIKVQDIQAEVLSQLCKDGFTLVDSQSDIFKQDKSMCLVKDDMLAFSPDCRENLDMHPLVDSGYFIMQDVPSYKFVDGIRSKIEQCSGDLVITESVSGVEAAHIASLLGSKGTVFVFNIPLAQVKNMEEKLSSLELTNVKLVEEPFVCVSHEDEAMANVKMIVCIPPITPSCIGHRVDYVMQEGDYVLSDMLQPPQKPKEETNQSSLSRNLETALTFNQCECIIYSTRSKHQSDDDSEEGTMVELVDQQNARLSKEDSVKTFITSDELDTQGCFATVIEREPDEPAPPPRDIIERAIAKGIIDGKGISHGKHKKSKGSKPKRPHIHVPMTIAAQQKVVQKKEMKNDAKIFKF